MRLKPRGYNGAKSAFADYYLYRGRRSAARPSHRGGRSEQTAALAC